MSIRIGQLSLSVAGLSPDDARALVDRLAVHLAAADAPNAPHDTDRLQVQLAQIPGESLDDAAARIARALLVALGRV